ncbi:MAG: 4-(cytidine 5'-diphospho)-2-C-methyl-D-erythritol kinase [Bacteroidales bacterium]
MITFPNAKINLGLSVVAKRPDGYHNLETVFYPVGIKDALEVIERPKPGCTLHISGIPVTDNQDDNLVVKAYRKLAERYPLKGVDIYLHKHIPFGAGMGGGSADAAFMLRLLNDQFELNIPGSELEAIAAELGADCPFFCRNRPVFAAGTGNLFSEVSFSMKGYFLVVVKPEVSVSTKDAFGGIVPCKPLFAVKEIVETKPVSEWREYLVNDFERTVFSIYPQLGAIKAKLYEAGAVYASMSGSGSSLFGIFDHEPDVAALFPGCFVWTGACEY